MTHDREALLDERRRVREAHRGVKEAMASINEAVRRLQESERLADQDVWSRSLVIGWMKRDAVRSAEVIIFSVDLALAELRQKLAEADVDDHVGPDPGRPPGAGVLDVWFDNLVSDLFARRRIRRTLQRLGELGKVLTRIQTKLARRERELTDAISQHVT